VPGDSAFPSPGVLIISIINQQQAGQRHRPQEPMTHLSVISGVLINEHQDVDVEGPRRLGGPILFLRAVGMICR